MIRDIPEPVIAAVNGFAIGGGHVLHVVCGITIAAEHAKFRQAGPRVADVAEQWGLLDRVVPFDELFDEVRSWADKMLAKSPTTLKVIKHSFNAETELIAGVGSMACDSLDLFCRDRRGEGRRGRHCRKEGPDFSLFP